MTDTTENAPQVPAFTPDDLVLAIQLIDEGVNQGAYKGWETIQRAMSVRTRLLQFAQHWQNVITQTTEQTLATAASGEQEGGE